MLDSMAKKICVLEVRQTPSAIIDQAPSAQQNPFLVATLLRNRLQPVRSPDFRGRKDGKVHLGAPGLDIPRQILNISPTTRKTFLRHP